MKSDKILKKSFLKLMSEICEPGKEAPCIQFILNTLRKRVGGWSRKEMDRVITKLISEGYLRLVISHDEPIKDPRIAADDQLYLARTEKRIVL